jgi:uncharacterized protein YdaU (DUF1376 family)
MVAPIFIFMADTFYFSHDYDSQQDEKIKDLLFNHGFEGYGIFWGLIENLYMNENRLKCDYKRIAYDFRTDEIKVKSIINDFNLFVIIEGYFHSESINKRLGIRNEKSEKAKKLAEKRWKNAKTDEHASKNDAGEHQHASKNDALASKNDAIKESKVKDIKGKEIKLKENKGEREGALPPALVECQNIFSDLEHPQYAESFYNYYESNGWLKGSNPIVNITAAAKTWIEKENKLYNQNKPQNGLKQHPTNSANTGVTRFDETANEFLRSIGEL